MNRCPQHYPRPGAAVRALRAARMRRHVWPVVKFLTAGALIYAFLVMGLGL